MDVIWIRPGEIVCPYCDDTVYSDDLYEVTEDVEEQEVECNHCFKSMYVSVCVERTFSTYRKEDV